MILILFIIVAVLFLSGLIYLQSERFRKSQAQKLLTSPGVELLRTLGFKNIKIGSIDCLTGCYGEHSYIFHIDSDDYFFNSSFSIVFIVAYKDLNDTKIAMLNEKYYNRVKSLLISSEKYFFFKDFAQFRFSNSLVKLTKDNVQERLDNISNIITSENLQISEFLDLDSATLRRY